MVNNAAGTFRKLPSRVTGARLTTSLMTRGIAWSKSWQGRPRSQSMPMMAEIGERPRPRGGATRHYYYSKRWQILEERVGASTTPDRQFIRNVRYIDDLVLRDKGSERFYVVHDYLNCTGIVGSYVSGLVPGYILSTRCALKCCAAHDECYDVNTCSFTSWISTLRKIACLSIVNVPALCGAISTCDQCNIDVLSCLLDCVKGISKPGADYYCAAQDRYIAIPGDFRTLELAKKCCCT